MALLSIKIVDKAKTQKYIYNITLKSFAHRGPLIDKVGVKSILIFNGF